MTVCNMVHLCRILGGGVIYSYIWGYNKAVLTICFPFVMTYFVGFSRKRSAYYLSTHRCSNICILAEFRKIGSLIFNAIFSVATQPAWHPFHGNLDWYGNPSCFFFACTGIGLFSDFIRLSFRTPVIPCVTTGTHTKLARSWTKKSSLKE